MPTSHSWVCGSQSSHKASWTSDGVPGGSDGKESAYNAGDWGLIWVRKIPWTREQQTIPVSLPGKPHGQRSLAGYSSWDHKESDTTEQLTHNWLNDSMHVTS